eukprot:GILJ01008100.1.p1 GENE.GILJ01008100.1~~GILJ01008100.1.p1  ORF type:complete len:550 (+),score=61.04 GILJ01008100.1:62-1711(+)
MGNLVCGGPVMPPSTGQFLLSNMDDHRVKRANDSQMKQLLLASYLTHLTEMSLHADLYDQMDERLSSLGFILEGVSSLPREVSSFLSDDALALVPLQGSFAQSGDSTSPRYVLCSSKSRRADVWLCIYDTVPISERIHNYFEAEPIELDSQYPNIGVNAGICIAAKALWIELRERLSYLQSEKRQIKLHVAGLSTGGCIAQVIAAFILLNKEPHISLQSVVTFGSLPVFHFEGPLGRLPLFDRTELFHVVSDTDVLPRALSYSNLSLVWNRFAEAYRLQDIHIPPNIPSLLMGYALVGGLMYIERIKHHKPEADMTDFEVTPSSNVNLLFVKSAAQLWETDRMEIPIDTFLDLLGNDLATHGVTEYMRNIAVVAEERNLDVVKAMSRVLESPDHPVDRYLPVLPVINKTLRRKFLRADLLSLSYDFDRFCEDLFAFYICKTSFGLPTADLQTIIAPALTLTANQIRTRFIESPWYDVIRIADSNGFVYNLTKASFKLVMHQLALSNPEMIEAIIHFFDSSPSFLRRSTVKQWPSASTPRRNGSSNSRFA